MNNPTSNPPQSPANAPLVLSPEDEQALARDIALRRFAETQVLGESPTFESLLANDFEIKPVGIQEYLTSYDYAGIYGSGLYPKWRDEIEFVADPANGISEWILTGSIGQGKSTVASLMLTYKLYRLGCLRNPCDYFGLMADSAIVFGLYSLFKYKSQDDNYEMLKSMIDGIPFFRERFPRPKHLSPRAADNLEFPRNVRVIAGSTELHAMGLNLLGLVLDEANFMKEQRNSKSDMQQVVSQAQDLYTASKRRLESRFQFRGSNPGLMVIISSRNAESSWLERHISEVQDDPRVHISDYPLWEVKPSQNYCGKRFIVEVGDAFRQARIITDLSEARPDARVICPPIEHQTEFERDIDGALRDIAGVANVPTAALFRDKEALRAAVDPKLYHPFNRPSFSINRFDDVAISSYFNFDSVIEIVRSFPRPRLNPHATRYLHVDSSESQDSTGLAMGHVSEFSGTKPKITMDFVLRILAPANGTIDFSKIVDFILYLHQSCGYPIKRASFDRFQSTHSRQILEKCGFESPAFSVDRNDEAYLITRGTIYEGRLCVYDYQPLFSELVALVHDQVRHKVDHPQMGSKDCADAVAAVTAQLSQGLVSDPDLNSDGMLGRRDMASSLQERLQDTGALATAIAGLAGR